MRVRLDSRGRPRQAQQQQTPTPPSAPVASSSPQASASATTAASAHSSSSSSSELPPATTDTDPSANAAPLASPATIPNVTIATTQVETSTTIHHPSLPSTISPPVPSKAPLPSKPPSPPSEPNRLYPRPPLPHTHTQQQAPRPPPCPAPSSSSSPAPAASSRPADDDRNSDSGSSLAEAYNSEDEHLAPTTGAPQRSASSDQYNSLSSRSLRDRERLFANQLHAKGLRIAEMRPDGNCLFRALAHALWGDAELHAPLRAKVIDYLVQESDYFSQFVAEDFARYVRRKSRDGTHGNHLELQAAAELFARPIEVYSYSSNPSTIIDSWDTHAAGSSARRPEPVRLSFHRGSHYNVVEPVAAANEKRAIQAKRDKDSQWRAAVDARATQDEMERAVLALSLVEASRGESAAGSSASSSAPVLPSTVLALIHAGYTEERAKEAYQVAGHGGLAEMVRYLTTDFFNPKSYTPPSARQISKGNNTGSTGAARAVQPSRSGQEPPSNMTERRPETTTALRKGSEAKNSGSEGTGSSTPENSSE